MENLENKEIEEIKEHEIIKKNIAANLTELRKSKKMTQAELATKFNYSDKAISKWERGEAIPDVITLLDLAKLYGVKLDYIVSDFDSKEKSKYKEKKWKKQLIITLLSALAPWLVACIVYMFLYILGDINYWLSFLWACAASCIILVVFNAIWGKRIYKFFIISTLAWLIILCIYLQLLILDYNIWILFISGVPIQIGFILWALLEK